MKRLSLSASLRKISLWSVVSSSPGLPPASGRRTVFDIAPSQQGTRERVIAPMA